MAIGTLGSAGDQFRDFLGGSQHDIGQGLQAVLSSYANPDGNFIRLADRAGNMFQLNSSEYQSVFDHDAQNQYAETWYAEYRAVLLMRAEALKKKLSRAYTHILENSIYAPIRPNESYAPQANRDVNDIDASSPLNFYAGGTPQGPPTPTNAILDTNDYLHPDWFSGSSKKSAGNAYDDIRQYINQKYPLDDIDGDGNVVTYNQGSQSTPAFDGGYNIGAEQGTDATYYDLWGANHGTANVYDLNSVSAGTPVWSDIALKMNVPPSTSTTHFVLTGSISNQYYIEIPPGQSSASPSVAALLPTTVSSHFDLGGGKFSKTEATNLAGMGLGANIIETAPNSGVYVLNSGTRFFDPRTIPSQQMFYAGSTADQNGPITGMNMNPLLVGPPGANLAEQDVMTAAPGSFPAYQIGFVDSWYEARALQKREAQVEAAYQAYLDGMTNINNYKASKGKTPWTYEQVMDQVFTAIDTVGGSGAPGAPLPPGSPPPVPSGTPTKGNTFNGLMPYGYYYFPGPTPGTTAIKHTPVNDLYMAGSDYSPGTPIGTYAPGTGAPTTDPGSVYRLIYDRLSMAADPSGMPGGNSGSAALSGSQPTPSGTISFPATPQPAADRQVAGGANQSHLYLPIPVGAAEMAGTGQPNINYSQGTAGLTDTTNTVPGQITANPMDVISKLFVGRQWDYSPGFDGRNTVQGTVDVAPVKYEAETISTHLMVLPGWFYDASGSSGDVVGQALVTLPPAIDGLAWQRVASQFGLGRIDDYVNALMGGPFFQVGGGSDSLGIYDIDGSTTKYSIAVGFGMGIGGIYWGHTSAIGTIDRIEELMDNSGVDAGSGVQNPAGGGGDPGPFFDLMKGSLTVLAGLGASPVGDMSVFPNVGLAGFHFDANIPIPIPPPIGLSFLNIPMTTYGSASYDILTDYMYRYLDAMKHEVVDSLSVYSYATSGGYAMDSYGMRGEYHFTEKTALNALKKMPDLFGFVPIADAIQTGIDMMGLSNYNIDNWSLKTDGILMGDYRHSFSAGEAREMDTGAFFTTASFLTQFQVKNMSYTYWTETHQNEEAANMDTLRMLVLTGKELMKFLGKTIFGVAGQLKWDGPLAQATLTVLNMMLKGFQESVNEAVIWDLLLHDQDSKGFVTTIKVTQSSLKSEGYDFIEDERKLFAFDYQGGPKLGIMQKAIGGGFGSFETPNQVLNGMANTRRYKPYMTGVDGRAGRQGWGGAGVGDTSNNAYASQAGNGEEKVHYLSRHEGQTSRYDDNWDITAGFWEDTGLGDINEVYVRKNTVTYNSAITNGLGAAPEPVVTTTIDRYVGSHNRIIGRGYDGAQPLDLQTFRTGYFSKKYFGSYITASTSELGPGATVVNSNLVQFGVTGSVDGRSGVNINLHGGENYYDRKNDYQLTMTAADGTVIDLKREAALAPTLGGHMQIGSVDLNNANQLFGASTTGETNELVSTIYDYMRVKSDGSNAQLVREYRDVFNLGLLDDLFITSSANAASGGGITSSIRLKFRSGIDVTGIAASATAGEINTGTYETAMTNQVVGTGTLQVEPGYLGSRDIFKNSSRAIMDIYLDSYFAFKRQPKTPAK